MSGLVVVKRRPRERNTYFIPCELGCHRNRGKGAADLGRSSATHIALILGRRVLLCSRCARNWQRWWDEAQDPDEAPEVLAA